KAGVNRVLRDGTRRVLRECDTGMAPGNTLTTAEMGHANELPEDRSTGTGTGLEHPPDNQQPILSTPQPWAVHSFLARRRRPNVRVAERARADGRIERPGRRSARVPAARDAARYVCTGSHTVA